MKARPMGLMAAGLLAGSMTAHAGLVAGSAVTFDLNPFDPPLTSSVEAGVDLIIGGFSIDFNAGPNGNIFNWTAGFPASLGGNTSFVLSGLTFDDGSTLVGFDVQASDLSGLTISTTASSLTVSFAPQIGASGTVLRGQYLTRASGNSVPEPGGLALVGLGLAGLAFTQRRKA